MDDYTSYLAHHGIKGQKWGIRRFQNPDGSLTAEGRKRRGVGGPRQSLRERFASKKNSKTDEEQREELKQYLRDHPKKLSKYSHELTRAEAEEIISNIQFDRRLKDIRKQEYDRGLEKIKTATDTMQTIANVIDKSKNVYNAYVDVHNAFTDGKKLTKIGERPEDDSKKKMDKWLQSASLEDIVKKKGELTNDQLKSVTSRIQTLADIDKAIKESKRDTSSYDSLRGYSRDDLMTALRSSSDRDVAAYAKRQKDLDAIEKSLFPEKTKSDKGNKKQDAELDRRISDIEEILEELRDRDK